jgi:hypothetical protein
MTARLPRKRIPQSRQEPRRRLRAPDQGKHPSPTRRGHRRMHSRGPDGGGCSADEFPRKPRKRTSSTQLPLIVPTASLTRNDLPNTLPAARIDERKGYKDAKNVANGTRNRGRCATQS